MQLTLAHAVLALALSGPTTALLVQDGPRVPIDWRQQAEEELESLEASLEVLMGQNHRVPGFLAKERDKIEDGVWRRVRENLRGANPHMPLDELRDLTDEHVRRWLMEEVRIPYGCLSDTPERPTGARILEVTASIERAREYQAVLDYQALRIEECAVRVRDRQQRLGLDGQGRPRRGR
jgi:hypothetical protein